MIFSIKSPIVSAFALFSLCFSVVKAQTGSDGMPPGMKMPSDGSTTSAQVSIGQKAPDFTLTNSHGQQVTLSQYHGKYVVLEWTDPKCPFVHKFYDGGDMQKLQKQFTSKGVIWLRINSSAPGRREYQNPEQAAQYEMDHGVNSTATLIDQDGHVGHLYGARTALHMFVINPDGKLIYAGAIDSIDSADSADIAKAKNYVATALDQSLAGQAVTTPTSAPYGCHIKY